MYDTHLKEIRCGACCSRATFSTPGDGRSVVAEPACGEMSSGDSIREDVVVCDDGSGKFQITIGD